MKDWEVESVLQELEGFGKPKIELEQYETPAELASHFMNVAERSYGDISGKMVLDLGCGAGMLSVAAALVGADAVLGCDIDPAALQIARSNIEEQELEDVIDFIQTDVVGRMDRNQEFLPAVRTKFDTVILNPPFGANKDRQMKGIDMFFLTVATSMVTEQGAIYSLHKSSTREHIETVTSAKGLNCEPLGEYRWNLDKTYKFHKKANKEIAVDMWRFTKKG
eukprot:TRINITY_DN12829_c0_g1_i1.p1 TRINITY_DN12829_c0_g1~~TRINITY_DN12829_c0_g1_i1.p1  ORF type:complete len:222 (+),score=46.22 TRINITY_DN12829_c0_g1_i1:64-729(+)